MSKSATKKCAGPCGATKVIAEFQEHTPGHRRELCRDCFNARRRSQHGAPRPEKPAKPIEEQISAVEEHHLKKQVADLQAERRRLLDSMHASGEMESLAAAAAEAAKKVTPIQPRERGRGKPREATALVLASDWHIEEEVRPEQVADRNRYNLDISKRRMRRFFEAARYAVDFNRQIFKVRDMVGWFGGDIITNFLHPDNVETNLLPPVQAIAYAEENISAGIAYWLEDPELERIILPMNDGNHGRLTEKMRSAARVANSIEWLLYTMLARRWAHEPRLQFLIAEGEHLYYDIYGRTVRFTHGDSVRYGGGVGGVTIPIYKAMARWQTVRHADLTCMGHFHQRTSLSDLIINGSLIGYSPYSLSIGARFEPPAQDFTILDPLRFKSVSMPLWVGEREDDVATRSL
jgi:hypothetical protein